MPDRDAVESHLPLKPEVLSILLVLAEGPQHGYAIIERVRQRKDGVRSMHTGPFYRHLRRLLDDELVRELRAPPKEVEHDARRGPYYALTLLGRAVADAECNRLRRVVGVARRLGLGGKRA